jgi:hypothetical protein
MLEYPRLRTTTTTSNPLHVCVIVDAGHTPLVAPGAAMENSGDRDQQDVAPVEIDYQRSPSRAD